VSEKTWRQKLEQVGGYENDMVGVNAGTVRMIIDELEDCREDNEKLRQRVLELELEGLG